MLDDMDKKVLGIIDELSDTHPFGVPATLIRDRMTDDLPERKLILLLDELKKDRWVVLYQGTRTTNSLSNGLYAVKLLKMVR